MGRESTDEPGSDGERAIEGGWRLLLLPGQELCPEEWEEALAEAERRGRHASRADGRRAACERDSEPWRMPRPADYVWTATLGAPAPYISDWRRRSRARLVTDARVCRFARAWERERRAALGLPAPPDDPQTLAHAVLAARGTRARAAGEHGERRQAVARKDGIGAGDPLRIALGEARAALCRAEEEYWLWVMLARADGLDVTPDEEAAWE
jgi:hypothetical protein